MNSTGALGAFYYCTMIQGLPEDNIILYILTIQASGGQCYTQKSMATPWAVLQHKT